MFIILPACVCRNGVTNWLDVDLRAKTKENVIRKNQNVWSTLVSAQGPFTKYI